MREKRRSTRKSLPAAMFLVFVVGYAATVVATGCKAPPPLKPSLQEQRIKSLNRQLSTLSQSDLIVFSDGRVWYVRSVQGGAMEVVGWIGDTAKSEEIDSFVLSNPNFTIVRKDDPKWAENRDKYLNQ